MLRAEIAPSVAGLQAALETLMRAGANEEQLKSFKAKCRERLPLAWVFASKEELSSRKLSGDSADGEAAEGAKADV